MGFTGKFLCVLSVAKRNEQNTTGPRSALRSDLFFWRVVPNYKDKLPKILQTLHILQDVR